MCFEVRARISECVHSDCLYLVNHVAMGANGGLLVASIIIIFCIQYLIQAIFPGLISI